MHRLVCIAAIAALLPTTVLAKTPEAKTPDECFAIKTQLRDAVRCLTKANVKNNADSSFVLPTGYLNAKGQQGLPKYLPYGTAAKPYKLWDEFAQLTKAMLAAQAADSPTPPAVPPGLAKAGYNIVPFHDATYGRDYWAAVESTVDENQHSTYGWGTIIVNQRSCCLGIQFAEPHPRFDVNSEVLAADVAARANACFFVVAGSLRNALKSNSTQDWTVGKCEATRDTTDPAHDPSGPYHTIVRTAYDEESARYGCSSATDLSYCAHLQIHGKGNDECVTSPTFVSAGTRNDAFYKGQLAGSEGRASRINALVESLQAKQLAKGVPEYGVTTPATDPTCKMYASTNIFNKWLQKGRPADTSGAAECGPEPSKGEGTTGFFVHAETDPSLRNWNSPEWQKAAEAWAEALQETYTLNPKRCAPAGIACGWSGVQFAGSLRAGDLTAKQFIAPAAAGTACASGTAQQGAAVPAVPVALSPAAPGAAAAAYYRALPVYSAAAAAKGGGVCLTVTAEPGTATQAAIYAVPAGGSPASEPFNATNIAANVAGRAAAPGATSFEAWVPAGARWQLVVSSASAAADARFAYSYRVAAKAC